LGQELRVLGIVIDQGKGLGLHGVVGCSGQPSSLPQDRGVIRDQLAAGCTSCRVSSPAGP
ncbi:hypothetical protein, partial [Bacillus mojavensis]|uniref:hypothetical protein n=1 Tax=Bacillus mojavensis TaxID=72360 RepID=UPI0028525B1D